MSLPRKPFSTVAKLLSSTDVVNVVSRMIFDLLFSKLSTESRTKNTMASDRFHSFLFEHSPLGTTHLIRSNSSIATTTADTQSAVISFCCGSIELSTYFNIFQSTGVTGKPMEMCSNPPISLFNEFSVPSVPIKSNPISSRGLAKI